MYEGRTQMQKGQVLGHANMGVIAGKARPSFIVSHRVGLDEAPEAYRRFDQRRDGYTEVILKPGNGASASA